MFSYICQILLMYLCRCILLKMFFPFHTCTRTLLMTINSHKSVRRSFISCFLWANYADTKYPKKWDEYFISNLFSSYASYWFWVYLCHLMFSLLKLTPFSGIPREKEYQISFLLLLCISSLGRRREVNCKAHEQSLLFHWGCHNKLVHSILRVWTKFIEVSITLHTHTYMRLNSGSYGKEKKYFDHV